MDRQTTSSPPPIGNSSESANSAGHRPSLTCSPEYAAERARLMFGCYRRGDANDADTYVAAVTMVLAHYGAEVVQAVTDPYSGLPSRKTEQGWSGLPDVADVREACDAEAAQLQRLAQYAALPRPERKRLPRPRLGAGDLATIFVHADHPGYAEMVERAGRSEAIYSKQDPDGRPGIWVPFGWYDEFRGGAQRGGLKRFVNPVAMQPIPQPVAAQPDVRPDLGPEPPPAEDSDFIPFDAEPVA